ncbi:hypothetical protein [Hyphomicrobium sp.]|uniref:hypothetical protein n=1 Tax=Hyphomicrobium sp. TaxID=82 RepID=UPI001DA03904|nr:hypothetical protein [Hyphomicrobium sp.]MBY0559907.1 hypothetical protein [Hyphomicrobium sp.]
MISHQDLDRLNTARRRKGLPPLTRSAATQMLKRHGVSIQPPSPSDRPAQGTDDGFDALGTALLLETILDAVTSDAAASSAIDVSSNDTFSAGGGDFGGGGSSGDL